MRTLESPEQNERLHENRRRTLYLWYRPKYGSLLTHDWAGNGLLVGSVIGGTKIQTWSLEPSELHTGFAIVFHARRRE